MIANKLKNNGKNMRVSLLSDISISLNISLRLTNLFYAIWYFKTLISFLFKNCYY